MSKKETLKFIVQMIASIATAIVTALGTTSCMGVGRTKKSAEVPYPSADFLPPSKNFPTCVKIALVPIEEDELVRNT